MFILKILSSQIHFSFSVSISSDSPSWMPRDLSFFSLIYWHEKKRASCLQAYFDSYDGKKCMLAKKPFDKTNLKMWIWVPRECKLGMNSLINWPTFYKDDMYTQWVWLHWWLNTSEDKIHAWKRYLMNSRTGLKAFTPDTGQIRTF